MIGSIVGLGAVSAPAWSSRYPSSATTFTPQVGTDRDGRAFKPAIGDRIEAGRILGSLIYRW